MGARHGALLLSLLQQRTFATGRVPSPLGPAPREGLRRQLAPQAPPPASSTHVRRPPESVPRKNLRLPLVAAAATARRCSSRFRMGRQKAWGRRPPTNSALRLSRMCCGVMEAATLGGAAATNSAASAVVMCSMTTLSSGTCAAGGAGGVGSRHTRRYDSDGKLRVTLWGAGMSIQGSTRALGQDEAKRARDDRQGRGQELLSILGCSGHERPRR